MSSTNRWFGTGLGGDAYAVVDETGREHYKNGRSPYIYRGSREFAEREAQANRSAETSPGATGEVAR